MEDKEVLRIYNKVYEYLDNFNIYEVRNIARAFGVNAPTTAKKKRSDPHGNPRRSGHFRPGAAQQQGRPRKGERRARRARFRGAQPSGGM